ncbi:MAG: imidazole glycerol phosphate synthase subunit HisF [Candidatus Nitrohelix vancouverensis]|uniref:imidazole glycerol-phosphate synthase n=1 Tax=Candidatus Nitrohelix vancouverensis TaxID=2705534 RepID=A0A7T0G280_9BACT|nr:MAG: imidazole glycerol phosphate synthase subunit HisF [Candidatus Nitrohelix vancouverensis]
MADLRLIARLDIKGSHLIKGVQLEGVRKIGDPNVFAKKYYDSGIDEILYTDNVASLYGRNSLFDIIRQATRDIFVPMTVGGGLRNLQDVETALRSGADKVAINTAAIQEPGLIAEASRKFGSQCIVLSIQAKMNAGDSWEAYCENGREHTGLDAVQWAVKGVELGAGEILLTSVDREGTCKGFDVDLVKAVSRAVSVPVIASGGMGRLEDLRDVVCGGGADAVAMAHVLHYGKLSVSDVRCYASKQGLGVRSVVNRI